MNIKGFPLKLIPIRLGEALQADYDQVAGRDSDYLLVDDQSQWRPDGQSHYFKIAIRAIIWIRWKRTFG